MAADDFFQPNGVKLILAAAIIVPLFFVLLLVTDFAIDMAVLAVISIIISYVAACVIDVAIESRSIKIAIASIAALITIVLGYLVFESMTMICDPVHDPGGLICDPVHVPSTPSTAPTVISTIQPTPTELIYDPVHQPGTCGAGCGVAVGTTTGIVAQKLEECKKKCIR